MRQARWPLLVVAVVVECVSLVGYADLFRHVLGVLDVRLSFGRVMNIVLAGLSFSHLFGAGGAAGMVVSYNALRKREVPHGLIFVAHRRPELLHLHRALGDVPGGARVGRLERPRQPLELRPRPGAHRLPAVADRLRLSTCTATAPRCAAGSRRSPLSINRLYRRERIAPENIDEWLDSLFAGMRRMGTHRGAKRTAVAYSCMFWVFDLLCLYLVFLALGYHVPLAALTVSYAVANAVGSLAPTPGGLGAIEGLMITLLVSFDVPSPQAIAVVLVYRLINFWMPIPVGFGSYLAHPLGSSRARSAAMVRLAGRR